MSSAGILQLWVQGVIILFFPEPLDALAMLQNDSVVASLIAASEA